MLRNPLRLLLLWSVALILVACGPLSGSAPPPTAEPDEPTATLARQPTTTPDAAPTTPPTTTPEASTDTPTPAVPPATLQAELAATVAAGLPPTATPEPDLPAFGGFDGVEVLPLEVAAEEPPLWAVFSYGFRSVEQNHFVAVYTRSGGAWRERDRVELEFPDFLDQTSVQQVEILPDLLWLEVQGGAGAHSGVYELFSFDGETLRQEAVNLHASPAAGELQDLNDDGTPDVVLNVSDPYIFCYACNVVVISYQVLRWDGARMVEVDLTPLDLEAPEELRQVTNEAVELARAGLWQEAAVLAEQAAELNEEEQNATAAWNIALIDLVAEERERHARTGEYPLLGHMFYGDYTAVLGILSGYSVEELFSRPNPLIVGTVAEGFETALVDTIQAFTTRALDARPDLAEAYFLRGWASYLADPEAVEALADIQRAAELESGQALFREAAEYLGSDQPATEADESQAVIDAAILHMQTRTGQEVEPSVVLEKLAGDYARVRVADPGEEAEELILFLKRENGVWGVITEAQPLDLEMDTYRRLGIPESLLEDLPDTAAPTSQQPIIDAVRAYAQGHEMGEVARVEVWAVVGDFARARTIPADDARDPAMVYLTRENDQWTVLLMGTAFNDEDLRQFGVPDGLISLEPEITAATRAFVQDTAAMLEPYYVAVQQVAGDYARVLVESADPNVVPVTAFLRRQNGEWVVLDMRDTFDSAFFEAYSIPERLRHNAPYQQ